MHDGHSKAVTQDSCGASCTNTLRFFTYDVISELTFGRRFGFLEKGEDFHNLVSGLLVGLPLIGLTQRIKFLNSIFSSNWVADKVNPTPTDKYGIGAVMGVRLVPYLISDYSANNDGTDLKYLVS